MNIQVGRWYIAQKNDKARPRWILAANERGVIYATGGVRHRECKLKTFMRWARKVEARPQ